jgi:hypothetical protein
VPARERDETSARDVERTVNAVARALYLIIRLSQAPIVCGGASAPFPKTLRQFQADFEGSSASGGLPMAGWVQLPSLRS